MSVPRSALSTAYSNQKLTLTEPVGHLSKRETNHLLFYFLHLDERNPHGFMKKWDQIPYADFTTKNYAQTVYKTAINLNASNITSDIRGKILSHLRTNIDAWLSPVLENIELFNEQNLASSLWSLAVLDSYYSGDSLTKPYYALRPYFHFHEDSNPIDQKQIRDADLWFTGHSNVPNPERNNKTHPFTFENNLCEAFDKSGFITELPDKPFISKLTDAGDFPVISPKKQQELWAEADGFQHFKNFRTAQTTSKLRYNVHTKFRSALERRLADPDSIILRLDLLTCNNIIELMHQNTRGSRKKMKTLCNKAFKYTLNAGPGIYRITDLNSTNPEEAIRPMVLHDRNLGFT